ncbi:hypothetical protein D9611_010242 [Ephemerocybe angulata]|uniref:Uncharacterized protein n=1 Tax=Ephemerocybe angulata TaxID=980116 RepID=A0A8H5F1T1_9AGAR|nr:hypothetical protein D9611_010242 [Tulosesus angulatus]
MIKVPNIYNYAPTYALGWMIKVPNIYNYGRSYRNYRNDIILPRWKKANFPDWYTYPQSHGCMIPDLSLWGEDHIFIQVSENTPGALEKLRSKAGTEEIVEKALTVLRLDKVKNEIGAYSKLLWVLPPHYHLGARKYAYPCIGDTTREISEMPDEMKDILTYSVG